MGTNSRRKFFQDAAILGVGLFGASATTSATIGPPATQANRNATNFAAHPHHTAATSQKPEPSPSPGPPMLTPDVPDLPHELDGNVKVFHLTAEPVRRKIAPFKTIDTWGYNGSCPGPTIQINQG